MFINTLGYINVYQNLGDMNVDVNDSLVDIDVDNCKDDNSYCVSQRFCIISWAWEYYYDESRRSYYWLILSLVFVVSLLVLLSFLRGRGLIPIKKRKGK